MYVIYVCWDVLHQDSKGKLFVEVTYCVVMMSCVPPSGWDKRFRGRNKS